MAPFERDFVVDFVVASNSLQLTSLQLDID